MRIRVINKDDDSSSLKEVFWTVAVLASLLTALTLYFGGSKLSSFNIGGNALKTKGNVSIATAFRDPVYPDISGPVRKLGESAIAEFPSCANHTLAEFTDHIGPTIPSAQKQNPHNLPRDDTYFLNTDTHNLPSGGHQTAEDIDLFEITGITKQNFPLHRKEATKASPLVKADCTVYLHPAPASLKTVVDQIVEEPGQPVTTPPLRKL